MKIAGRDAGKVAVVIDVVDENYVIIDGQTRRRKCNISHLELIDKDVKVKKNATNAEVVKALKEIDIECVEKKAAEKKEKGKRPKKQKKVSKKEAPAPKEEKKPTKPAAEKKEEVKEAKK